MDATSIELSKINFILENLVATWLHRVSDNPIDDCEGLAEEMHRQFTALPATVFGEELSPEQTRQAQEAAGQRMDLFWAGVRERLRSS
ncbi:hypothetical protein [Pelagerythrobacter marinus]|jgi:hypothetical protein|uniref:Uncharacterized protein n=1 Tax=Pelagerythrobacter marinus TaxID=538382 RepID=A0ABW9UVE9_9SPHN|nr:hypothetical protein [Pelagerythrobacter marinus]MXO67768.1 hypothetical protein [Pelagerythrobacter marinus]WPZ05513.1 hypothetical protein T8T98_08710 [Pelagerythrobacter marinus]